MLIINNLVHIAIVTKVHGYLGELKVKCNPDFIVSNDFPAIVFLIINKKPVPFFVEYFTIMDSTSLIVKFENISNKDEAIKLTNLNLFADIKAMDDETDKPPQPSLLIGYQVFDQNKNIAGTVTDVIPNVNQFLLEIDKNILLPMHEDLIIKIDKKKKIIWLQIADGLI